MGVGAGAVAGAGGGEVGAGVDIDVQPTPLETVLRVWGGESALVAGFAEERQAGIESVVFFPPPSR